MKRDDRSMNHHLHHTLSIQANSADEREKKTKVV
jgi:hypothetical protein